MPLLGTVLPEQLEPAYFKSLEELDEWSSSPHSTYDTVLPYKPRSLTVSSQTSELHGKLLVCHDYKGGYTESPHSFAYTFNFWSLCDTFVYFSHYRVTIPPPGWISAAHRQGVKMLGTLIFEGDGEQDCLRLLVGRLPKSKTGPAARTSTSTSLPLSPHYARLLADLAKKRGFDGYLLNFECPLRGGIEQTRALAAWITILRRELVEGVGKYAEVVWYDSVVITGQLAWQDRLNNYNLPFFLSSSSIFTNYTWRNNYPSLTAQYFLTLDPSLVSNESNVQVSTKSLQDIYVGIDIWGRGSHGNGGFGAYKALSHIEPSSLGLSVAIFGQAWSWESEQDKPSFTWESWWDYDRKLWAGVIDDNETVQIPDCPMKKGEEACTHGAFVPFKEFFKAQPPPNVDHIPFHTTFCPGAGRKWFVNGKEVFVQAGGGGWTDVDKQTSLGDLVWPKPEITWDAQADPPEGVSLPSVLAKVDMRDAWNGGSSLRMVMSDPGSQSENAVFRCVRVPIQSLTVTANMEYEATAIYKVDKELSFDVDASLSVKALSSKSTFQITPTSENDSHVGNGWMKLAIQFTLLDADAPSEGMLISLGFTLAIVTEDPSQPFELPILLGQLNVHPSYPINIPKHTPMILWVDFSRSTSELSGIISYETATSLPLPVQPSIASSEDPVPAWVTQPTSMQWFTRLMYANIYAQWFDPLVSTPLPSDAVWIGTTKYGLGGRKNVFDVQRENLPPSVQGHGRKGRVRVYVQGVSETGEVMKWEQCAYVDIE
ncbi:hypothetical protein E1B28_011463 [Marasmius oreades]|uniref:Cytosolic endo-beta-N-acetylglucosaminidase TIM barrel domain-containing protein n=1 Tax=Marasmius oreades TaxID=181124 RepID=A0A9P7RU48_9AGAR|nr:uncharacterized protein E1B28_011463 [Marasmius oreades]KAG7089814.1 hypothetical protein E1B28_011463 [Marasmius oreades]